MFNSIEKGNNSGEREREREREREIVKKPVDAMSNENVLLLFFALNNMMKIASCCDHSHCSDRLTKYYAK
jgi:hypothetical protein